MRGRGRLGRKWRERAGDGVVKEDVKLTFLKGLESTSSKPLAPKEMLMAMSFFGLDSPAIGIFGPNRTNPNIVSLIPVMCIWSYGNRFSMLEKMNN